MKKYIISAALVLVIPLMSISQTTLGPGVTGTTLNTVGMPHNFSTQSWNPFVNVGLGGQICQPCHTPHNADINAEAPLWNHQMTTASYTMYTGIGTFGASGAGYGVTAPDGTSKLCLSCHDGSVALGSFGGQTGLVSMSAYNSGLANLDLDLTNDHPISIPYDSTIVASAGYGGVWGPTHIYSGTRTVQSLLDHNNKVQCTSCHTPHSNSRGYQLKMSNIGSALCLACHNK